MIFFSIATYIINLKKREDRKQYIQKEFVNKWEFNVSIIEAVKHDKGVLGLWETIKYIIQCAINNNTNYILICEDDHQFTADYSENYFNNCVKEAKKNNADILCGGVSWFEDAIQVTDNLFWVKKFSGTQFVVVFKKFYSAILNAEFNESDSADFKICSLSDKIFFIHPFISVQKEFGYSDATSKNNGTNRVEELFIKSADSVQVLKDVSAFYKSISKQSLELTDNDYNTITIPTYIINLPERTERREHIEKQFAGKKEFDITIIKACKHEIGAVGLWLSVRKIIEMAIQNDDDVIVICEDDHQFTEDYSRNYFLKNVIEAHNQGADYLSGGTGSFGLSLRVAENRYWVNPCLSAQFIVVYKKLFYKILDEPFDNAVIGDILLSEMASNKMVIYPFISIQKNFGYSDVTPVHNENKNLVTTMFNNSMQRLKIMESASDRLLHDPF